MRQSRHARGRPPASSRAKSGNSRPRGRPSGRSGRGASVVVKLPHVGARTAMRTSRRIPHRRSVEDEEPPPPPPESDTDAAEEVEEHESLPPVAAYEEHQADDESAPEEDMTAVTLAGPDSGGRRSRTSAARSDYIKRRFLYAEEEAARAAAAANRHRGRHPRDPRSGHHPGRRGRKPRHKPEEMVDEDEPEVDDMGPLRIAESEGVRRRGRRRRSEMEEEMRMTGNSGLVKRSRRWGGRRREEEELLQVDDVGIVLGSESVDSGRRHSPERRRGRGRPPKSRSQLFVHDELVSSHHDILRGVSPSTGAVTGQSSPGMAEYEDDEDDDEEEMKAVAAAAYGATDFGDDEGLLSPSDESPVLVSRHGVRPVRSGYEIEDDEDYDDIEEASALVYGRPPRNAPTMSPGGGGRHHAGHHPHSHASPPPHPSLAKKYSRRHKMPSSSRRPTGVPGPGSSMLDPEGGASGGAPSHHLSMHVPGGHAQVSGPGVVGVVTSGSGRESVKSEDDIDDEFMFEEGAAFTADNDPPVGGEGTTTGLSHTTHHGPMTGIPGPWSAGRRKTPLKPLTAGGPRTSDLDIFMNIGEEEGIMPMGAPRGEHSYSAMAQKGAVGHGAGLQDMDYYPPAATQQYVEPPPDSHVPPPLNKPAQHRHGRNASRRPSILPRRTALPRQRQPSLCTIEGGAAPADPETSSASVVEMPVVVSDADVSNIPVSAAEGVESNELLPAVSTAVTAPVTSQATQETEPSPAVAASASAKLFHLRNLKRKEEQEKAAAALNTVSGGLPVEAIPPEGAVLVAGIPAFRVAPGGLSILRRIPSTGGTTHVAVSSTTSPTNATVKTVLGAANQQQPLTTTSSQLSTGAATPAGDAWLKSKNMRIVVFRNEKGEQKTVVMPEDGSVRRIVSTGSSQITTSGSSVQPYLIQSPPQQSQQLPSQQFVTIQQPQATVMTAQQQPQQPPQPPPSQQQPIRYVKIINPSSGAQLSSVVGGVLKK